MQSLILLHGALGNASTMQPIADALKDQFDVYIPDLPGHGSLSVQDLSPSVQSLTHFLHEYIQHNRIYQPVIFGYSLGGYVALYHELMYPGTIKRTITFATKYLWNPGEAEKQKKMLDGDVIEMKVPAFAQVLRERHGEHWKQTLSQTATLMSLLGQQPLLTPETVQKITIPVCVAVGSEDLMVTREESEEIAQSLPHGEFKILEGLPHGIEKVPGEVLAELIRIKCA